MSNCFFWAIKQYWQKGGYIIMRQAHPPHQRLPHFLWSPDLHEFWEFTPLDERRWFFFRGKVRQAYPVADTWIEGFQAGVEAIAGKR